MTSRMATNFLHDAGRMVTKVRRLLDVRRAPAAVVGTGLDEGDRTRNLRDQGSTRQQRPMGTVHGLVTARLRRHRPRVEPDAAALGHPGWV